MFKAKSKFIINVLSILICGYSIIAQADSTSVQPPGQMTQQQLESNVNLEDCTTPISSGAYVIAAGVGGRTMSLACPESHPVMYNWQQTVGYGGIGVVSWGGGESWTRCCAMKHQWQAAPPPA